MPLAGNIILSSAALSDIPTLARISGIAFRSDTHTQLKAQFDGDTSHEDGMQGALKSWIDSARCNVVVARERPDKEAEDEIVVGWICWGKRGDDVPSVKDATETPHTALPDPRTAPRTIAGLKALNDDTMSYYVEHLMPPGVRCRFIIALNVLPSHQGRGIGSALIQWGTKLCDEEGVFCWVSSSMDGWSAFEKQGFQEVGRLEVDLDEFCEVKTRPGGESWGKYVWRWSKRDALGRPDRADTSNE